MQILKKFEFYYKNVLDENIDGIYESWNERSMLLGNQVSIETTDSRINGEVLRIDRSGALIVLNKEGIEKRILNGDVSVRRAE